MAESHTYSGNGLTATIADPNNITRDECLALARCGAVAWNAWREEFPGEPVPGVNTACFENCDFVSESIKFEGFRFGQVNFSNARFASHQLFWHCSFGSLTSFEHAVFAGSVRFQGSEFGSVDFNFAVFSGWADFKACDFKGSAHFEGCQFNDIVAFAGAILRTDACFEQSRFAKDAYFGGALFGSDTNFSCCEFAGRAEFGAWEWSGLRYVFQDSRLNLQEVQSLAGELSMSPARIGGIDFSGAAFWGAVNFSGRSFRARASFDTGRRLKRSWTEVENGKESSCTEYALESTRFAQPPQFFDCEINQQLTFDDAVFPSPSGDATSARAYRTLKLAFSEQQATREEQRFFKLEMQEEAAAESSWKRLLYRAYEVTSDFGFSVWRPLVTLVLLPALVAMLFYLLCMSFQHPKLWASALAQDSKLTSAWLQFSFANMAPLPDGELLKDLRTDLFGSNTYAAFFALKLETLQKVLALAGYFLFGLALRNLFKMK